MRHTPPYLPYHKLNILVTGFGPFPGVTENISESFIHKLATEYQSASPTMRHLQKHMLTTHTFRCEWEDIKQQANQLYHQISPHLIIHFGVNAKIKHLAIERYAYNTTNRSPDVSGHSETGRKIYRKTPIKELTPFPTQALWQKLQAENIPSALSTDPGRYLCNFLYYQSLQYASSANPHCLALFVHIPTQNYPFLYDGITRILSFAVAAYPKYMSRISF